MKIKLTENKLKQIVSESVKKVMNDIIAAKNNKKTINESKPVKSDKYTIDDINWLDINGNYIDGYIHANAKRDVNNLHVPLNIEFYVGKNRINAFGLTYAEWARALLSNNTLRILKERGFDIENPQLEEGWYYVTRIVNNVIFIDTDEFDEIPLPAYDICRAFNPGGELYQKSPKQISDIFRITDVGEYVD